MGWIIGIIIGIGVILFFVAKSSGQAKEKERLMRKNYKDNEQ